MRKQDRNCAHKKVTLRRIRETMVAEEKNKYYIFCVFVYSLGYSERKANEPYCIASVACLAVSFSSALSHKRHDFREK